MKLDVADGYVALRRAVAGLSLPREMVRVAGPDAIAYLQGQLSQDVVALRVGEAAWTFVLQPQGKVDVWARITRVGDDDVVLDTDAGWGGPLLQRLERFKLRTRADFELLPWRCAAVRGPAARPIAAPNEGEIVVDSLWPGLPGFDLLGSSASVPADVPEVPALAWEVVRIEAGLPMMGHELTDRTIPAEAGVVEQSVSFTKGCFTGQELVARIDSRGGRVARRLRGLVAGSGAAVPGHGSTVEVDGRAVGTVTSAARHPDGGVVALAYIGRDVDVPGAVTVNGGAARIAALPLLS